jgi:hypothetical protein
MGGPETLAYILLKSLYVFGIVCGLTPPLLLIAVLSHEWWRIKKTRMLLFKSEPHPERASGDARG